MSAGRSASDDVYGDYGHRLPLRSFCVGGGARSPSGCYGRYHGSLDQERCNDNGGLPRYSLSNKQISCPIVARARSQRAHLQLVLRTLRMIELDVRHGGTKVRRRTLLWGQIFCVRCLSGGEVVVTEVGGGKLSCFPLGASFVRSHTIHHLVGHRNSSTLNVLIRVLSCVCTNRKCCIHTSHLFCRSLSTNLCRGDTSSIRHVIHLTIRCKLFSTILFRHDYVLASIRVRQRCLFDAHHHDVSRLRTKCYLLTSSRPTSGGISVGRRPTFKDRRARNNGDIDINSGIAFVPRGMASNARDVTRGDASRRDMTRRDGTRPRFGSPLGATKRGTREGGVKTRRVSSKDSYKQSISNSKGQGG